MAAKDRIEGDAAEDDAQAIADAAIQHWDSLLNRLSPLIGANGARALYARCLHLATSAHPWLAQVPKPITGAWTLAELGDALRSRSADEARAGCAALDAALAELLSRLIGTALTDRFLNLAKPPMQRPVPTLREASDD